MTAPEPFEIYLVATPGLEGPLCAEVRALGYKRAKTVEGGVSLNGTWEDVWRLNLEVRGATRVLARVAKFHASHLAQLDKLAHQVAWEQFLRGDVPVSVDASCRKSKIYHAGAAAERVGKAISNRIGASLSDDAALRVMVRIEKDEVTISLDSSGASLHKRGFKAEVNRAPMRETMAALFLRQCGYTGDEPLLDPMCGSGTFVIEAAEIALGLKPGRGRDFAFELLPGFDGGAFNSLKSTASIAAVQEVHCFGSDRDPGAVRMAKDNATRAGVADVTRFIETDIDNLQPPTDEKGLVIINPPYGARIGSKAPLLALYRTIGRVLCARFAGWRVGLVTADADLARATGLPFEKPVPPVLHGGMRIALYRTANLG